MHKTMCVAVWAMCAVAAAAAPAAPDEPQIRFSSTPSPRPESSPDLSPDLNPDHVPTSSCVDMLPVHGNHRPSKVEAPYTISANTKQQFKKGDTANVLVKGLGSETFLGVYMQARIGDRPVGHWKPHSNPQVHISDCPPGAQNAISYVSGKDALNVFAAEWVAEGDDVVGEVVFTTTLVKSFDVFWVNVTSQPLKVSAS